jgi:hypothetical protein
MIRAEAEPAALPLDADLLCCHCQHNLRGVPSSRCPECGSPFDRARTLAPVVPWEHRHYIGRLLAYARTVRLVTFQPGGLLPADTITRRAAARFRDCTVWLVFVTLCGGAVAWRMHPRVVTRPFRGFSAFPLWDELLPNGPFFAAALVATLLWLFAVAALASSFFLINRDPLARQDRALALSHYALAPLAWLPPMALTTGGVRSIGLLFPSYLVGTHRAFDAIVLGLTCCLSAPFIAYWGITLRLLYRATGSGARTAIAALLLPPLWLFFAAFIFFAVEFAMNYLALLSIRA